MFSGGAPLSRDTHEFLRTCFCCAVLQGYGLTETCGGGTLQHIDDPAYETVGAPVPGCQIKLVDVEEMNYRSSNNPPKGEVWIRGGNVATDGYYKNPKITAEAFHSEGWFATGDVGGWAPDGSLKIIDRVKNLVKLSNGEYIALEGVESRLKASPVVDNICLYVDSKESFAVALVAPSRVRLTEWAEANGIADPQNFEKLCENPKAKAFVLSSLNSVGKAAKLRTFELPRSIYLCSEEWTPQNGMLTAAMKLKRAPVTTQFKKQLIELYKQE